MSSNNNTTKSRFDDIDWDAIEAEQMGTGKAPFDNWEVDNLNSLSLDKVDYSKNLLGNRWVGRGQLGLIVGSSGIGKSVTAIQMQAAWSIGRPAFGIAPVKPLKILMLQAEDDKNDRITMATGVVDAMGVDTLDRGLLVVNTIVLSGGDRIGDTFVNQLDDWIERYNKNHETGPIDLIIINPAFAYVEGEVDKPEAIRNFLRWGLMLIATKHNLGVIVVHHTPKSNNRKTDEYKAHDWMYSSHGSAEWTNAARAVLTIEQTKKPHLFRFIMAKRGGYSGWEKNDNGIYERYYKHDDAGKLVWHEASAEEVEAVNSSHDKVNNLQPLDVLVVLGQNPNGLSEKQLYKLLSEDEGIKGGRDSLKAVLETLLDNQEIVPEKKPSTGGRSSIIYQLAPRNGGGL